MADWREHLTDEERDALKEGGVPQWTEPMLAALTHDYFSDEAWIFERKLDGQRCLAFRDGDDLRLLSRNRKALNTRYPELVDPLRGVDPRRFVLDGEVVAFEDDVTSFSRLQPRMQLRDEEAARASDVAIYLYVFDLLHVDGYDVTCLPLRTRKRLLRRLFSFDDPVRRTPHRNAHGEAYLEEACAKGWEGLIAKRADAPYSHSRSKDWLKFKCTAQQELVVGGFTEPKGSRPGFGALLLGYYDGETLRYAGKVGTGFDDETLERLHDRMTSIERKTPPFDDGDIQEKGVHWITPKLVAEIGFTEWTGDGKLRHPRFRGLRDDKRPEDVVRETPA